MYTFIEAFIYLFLYLYIYLYLRHFKSSIHVGCETQRRHAEGERLYNATLMLWMLNRGPWSLTPSKQQEGRQLQHVVIAPRGTEASVSQPIITTSLVLLSFTGA